MAVPVVGKYVDRGELLVYGGRAHFSSDFLEGAGGWENYGAVARWEGRGWGPMVPGANVVSLSQEHGLIKAGPDLIARVNVGDVIPVIPVHSCLLAYHIRRYVTLDGDILSVGGML
jgi:D-serine deaminase-like pyridoxal phosphate-dependent protein